MEMGKDFGLIAYNENPFYEIIGNGVPCISIDFNLLGDLAGNFVLNGEKNKAISANNSLSKRLNLIKNKSTVNICLITKKISKRPARFYISPFLCYTIVYKVL